MAQLVETHLTQNQETERFVGVRIPLIPQLNLENMATKMTAQEKKWRAESDARTLAEAQKILQDKARSKAAKSAAMNLAKDLESSATNMKLAAGGRLKK